jgi:hypothetical protein
VKSQSPARFFEVVDTQRLEAAALLDGGGYGITVVRIESQINFWW